MHNKLNEQQKLIDLMQKNQTQENKGNYAYAVATDNLKAGEIVADSDVDFKQFDVINTNAFDNRSDIVNKVLLKDIQSGETFTTAHIAKVSGDDETLKVGYRALTLPSDSFQGRSSSMKPGTYVDIYSASNENSWVLENIKIISFESSKKDEANSTPSILDATAITFEVASNDISEFISNISKNKLVLVTRGSSDKKMVHKKTKSFANFDSAALKSLPSSVPIKNLTSDENLQGLPEPIQPTVQQESVEVIEANVKSKVTFD